TTYQQVASNPDAVRAIAGQSIVILDEIHHAGDDRAWGESVRRAFEVAPRRVALSGTPFRSDTLAIPFVRYVGDEAVPDFEYGYADALADGRVVRPVYFPRINGYMEWIAPDGSAQAAAFDDALDRTRAAQRLRTALSLDGAWLPTVLLPANERLPAIRPPPHAARRRRPRHRRRPGPRPGHRRPAALPLRGPGHGGGVGRSDVVEPHRPLLGVERPVDRGGAHGVGGRRHPAAPGRRLCDHD